MDVGAFKATALSASALKLTFSRFAILRRPDPAKWGSPRYKQGRVRLNALYCGLEQLGQHANGSTAWRVRQSCQRALERPTRGLASCNAGHLSVQRECRCRSDKGESRSPRTEDQITGVRLI